MWLQRNRSAHDACRFVTQDDGIALRTPLVSGEVNVAVTHADELAVDIDIAWSDLAPLDRRPDERIGG